MNWERHLMILPCKGRWQREALTEGVLQGRTVFRKPPSTAFGGMHGPDCPPDNPGTSGGRSTHTSPRSGEDWA